MQHKRFRKIIKKTFQEYLILGAIAIVILLSSINLSEYFAPKKVLGTTTNIDNQYSVNKIFWENFLKENPEYIPGWIELGNLEKARSIDPNYIDSTQLIIP